MRTSIGAPFPWPFQTKRRRRRRLHHTTMEEAKRILVIEDDPILRDLVAEWLLAAGYRVGTAPDGTAGIADARERRPALVATDMCMPGAGGAAPIYEVTRLFPGLPAIA